MKPFPLIKIRPGSPREMGIQYGRQARERILTGIEDYRLLFSEIGAMSWENMRQYASSFFTEADKELPEITAEVEGIAEGAGVERDDVMVLNCRYEITKFPGEKEMDPNECTSFAVLSEAAAKENGRGKTYVGQNWDYRAGIIDNVIVLHVEQPDGTRILGLAEAGQVIRNGFNSHGIGLCANNLQSTLDRKGVGIPVTFLRRKILSSRSFEEAFKLILKAKRTVSANFMIASSEGSTEGRAADLEAFPGGADVLEPKDGIVVHANHFVADPSKNALETSPRGERLEDLLRQKHGHIDVPYLIRGLSDHENYPKAICRHPADTAVRLGRRSITVAGVIYDLEASVAHICAGPSCEGAFVVHTL